MREFEEEKSAYAKETEDKEREIRSVIDRGNHV